MRAAGASGCAMEQEQASATAGAAEPAAFHHPNLSHRGREAVLRAALAGF